MWLRNIFTKTLRDQRAGVLGWGLGLGIVLYVSATQYKELIGGIGPERQKLIEEITRAFQSFSFIMGEITDLGSIGGFINTRVLGFVPVMLALWAAVAGVGAVRGEEQNGSMEVLLATPHSRPSVFRSKALGILVSLTALVLLLWLGLYAGIAAAGEAGNVGAGAMLLTLINILALAAFWGAAGLLIGQLVGLRRTASSITGALLFGTFLMDNLLSTNPSLKWLAWLSPYHYYSVSKPIVPGRILEWGAWLVLLALTVAIVVLAGLLFTRRDIGSIFRLFPARARKAKYNETEHWLLTSPLGKGLRDLVWPTVLWGLGLGLYGTMVLATANETLGPLREVLKNAGWLALLVGDMTTTEGYVSYSLFTFLPAMFAIYAVLQVNAWAEDEEEGRMETLTSMPLHRWQHLLPRYIAFALSLLGILSIIGICLWATATATNTPIAADRTVWALLTTLPASLVILGLGLTIATWLKRPGLALPITSALVAAMFILDLFAPVFDFPEAVTNLSIFHLYGKPLTEGIKWGSTLILSTAAIFLAAASVIGFQRRDIAK
jgi:ABC-2 type transport system permease protein